MDRWRARWAMAVRRTPVAAISALVVLAIASAAAIASGGGTSAYDPSSAPGAAAAEDHARSAAQLRSSPEAKAQRTDSRHRFGNASNEHALAIAKDSFPGPISADVWRDVQLGAGEHVRRHLGTNALLIEKAGQSGDAIVESNVPLEAKSESGALAPVELALQDQGAAFESKNPIVPVRYFKDARKGFELVSSGIGVHPAGAPAPDASPAQNVASKTFFPNVDSDTDFWVTPEPSGAQAQWQLRSQSSPERLSLDLSLPRGAHFRLAGDGHGEIVRGDTQLASVSPPAAVDASGQQVPVHYESSGPKLTVVVDHRSADVMYPILVDPSFNDCFDWIGGYFGCGTTTTAGPWKAQSYGPYYMFLNGPPDAGLTILGGAVAYTNGQWAEWYLDPWRAHITIPRAEFQTSERSQYTCTYTGLWTNPNQYRDTNCNWYDGRWNTQCLPQACSTGWDYIPASDRDFARATFGYYKLGAGTPCCTHWTDLRRSYIYYWDYYAPSVDIPDLGSRPWAEQDSATLTGSINDWGIGLASEHVRAAGAGGGPNPYDWSTGCLGDRSNPCPSSNGFPGGSLVLDTAAAGGFGRNGSAYREGVMPIYVDATERIGRTTTKRVAEFKIDRSAPAINPTGTLVQPDGTWIKEGSYTLYDTPSDQLSGVQSDAFSVSNSGSPSGDTAAPGCDTSSGCPTNPAQHAWTWPASGPDGAHQVTVTAKDPVGHPTSRSWNVNLDTRPPALSGTPSGSLWDHRTKVVDAGTYDLHLSAADPAPGSGTSDIQIFHGTSASNGTEEDAAHSQQSGCSTTSCPLSMPRDYIFDTTGRAEGEHFIKLVAHDKVGHPGATLADFSFGLDTSPPTVQLSGSLYDARNTQLAPGTYDLQVHAIDGDATSQGMRAGVKSIEVLVDGVSSDYDEQPCDKSCDMRLTSTLDTSELAGGHHTVEVIATDQLDHETSTTIDFDLPCCLNPAASWGTALPGAAVYFADVNGDGFADAVQRDALGQVSVALSDGNHFGTPASWGSWSQIYDIHLADVDGDGSDDLVGRDALGNVAVSLSTGSAFGPTTQWGAIPTGSQLLVADVDGTGTADAIGRDPNNGAVVVAYSDTGSAFESPVAYASSDPADDVQFVDMNGDAMSDMVGRNRSTGSIEVALAGDQGVDPASVWGTWDTGYDVRFGDINGDGMADAVARRNSDGAVEIGSSTGTGFGSHDPIGSWDGGATGHGFDLADVNGDDSLDVVGAAATGDIQAATSSAPIPAGFDIVDPTPDPDLPWGDDVLDASSSGTSGTSVQAAAAAPPAMKIAFQDDRRLLGRGFPFAADSATPRNFDPNDLEPRALENINRIYERIQQAGGSVIRFNVVWGSTENRKTVDTNNDGKPDAYPNGDRYYFEKLDKAVRIARSAPYGFKVELTITGANVNNDCSQEYNPNGISCTDPHGETATNPNADAYGTFVHNVVLHYTRAGGTENGAPLASSDPLKVQTFSIWNEPNSKAWLRLSDTSGDTRTATGLYRELYKSAYANYRSAIDPISGQRAGVSGTQILIGELASATVHGVRVPGVTNTRDACFSRCTLTPVDWLKRVANQPDDPLYANGLAYHPYDDSENPTKSKSPANLRYPEYVGIVRLKTVTDGLKALCAKSDTAPKVCTGGLRRPDHADWIVPLFLTEFGYRNKAQQASSPARIWHTESVRAAWLYGVKRKGVRKGALDDALRAGAKWMLLYTATEELPVEQRHVPKNPEGRYGFETGLFGLKPDSGQPQNDDIVGLRDWGKRKETGRTFILSGANIRRKAYCAVRRWARLKHYPNVTGCPRPGT